jgi:Tfp pilus assembly protein PilO
MAGLRWHVRQWLGLLGWQGLVGIALAAAAVAIYFAAIDPAKARTRELQQEAVSIRAFSRASADAAKASAPGYEAWLEQFYRLLPAKASAPDWLRIIFAAARSQSLGLEQGEYKITIDKNGRLLAYEIGLPVRGTYVQVRKFIADVLEKIPAIALDEIVIKREAINANQIDASIRFTLFLNAF